MLQKHPDTKLVCVRKKKIHISGANFRICVIFFPVEGRFPPQECRFFSPAEANNKNAQTNSFTGECWVLACVRTAPPFLPPLFLSIPPSLYPVILPKQGVLDLSSSRGPPPQHQRHPWPTKMVIFLYNYILKYFHNSIYSHCISTVPSRTLGGSACLLSKNRTLKPAGTNWAVCHPGPAEPQGLLVFIVTQKSANLAADIVLLMPAVKHRPCLHP